MRAFYAAWLKTLRGIHFDALSRVPFAADIVSLAENRQRLDFIKADAAMKAVADTAARVRAAETSATRGAASAAIAVRAAQEVDTLNGALTLWFNFFNGYEQAFTAAVPKPYQALSAALDAYAATLREKLAGLPPGTGRLATGRGGAARDSRRRRKIGSARSSGGCTAAPGLCSR